MIGKHAALWLFLPFLFMPAAWASSEPLYRGARAQGLGGAFTGVADDDQALYYNPAGLAGSKGYSFTLGAGNLEASSDLLANYASFMESFSNASVQSINTLIGKNVFARTQVSAAAVFPGFGLGAIYDLQLAIRLKNKALPQGALGYQTTYGFQGGFGSRVFKFKRKKGEIRFGIAGKALWRSGGYISPTLTQLLTANTKAILGNLAPWGLGYGVDAGVQAVYHFKKRLSVTAAFVGTDLGGLTFTSGADMQRMNLTAGFALNYKTSDMSLTLAYDYNHLLDNIDWVEKSHLGVEFVFPALSLFMSMRGLSFSYGIGLDLFFVKIYGISYIEDLSIVHNVDPEQRYLVHAAVKFDL